jgi:hypothetical protein
MDGWENPGNWHPRKNLLITIHILIDKMVKIKRRERARFRIQVHDFKLHKSKTITLEDNRKLDVEIIKSLIVRCLENTEKLNV